MTTWNPASRRTALVACVVAALLSTTVSAPGGWALHQNCSPDTPGIGAGYPEGTYDTGYPDPDPESGGWGGLGPATRNAKIAAFSLDRATGALDIVQTIVNKAADDPVSKKIEIGTTTAKLALTIGKIAAEAVVLDIEHRNAQVDNCSGTLQGDMVDTIFVGMLEEGLAYYDAQAASTARSGGTVPPGTRVAGPGTFVLPDDGLPYQTAETDTYDHLAGHGDLEIYYQHGYADADTVGVAHVVRNEIALLERHGLVTDGRRYNSMLRRYESVPHPAKTTWARGADKLAQGDLRAAHQLFVDAYQLAVDSAAVK